MSRLNATDVATFATLIRGLTAGGLTALFINVVTPAGSRSLHNVPLDLVAFEQA